MNLQVRPKNQKPSIAEALGRRLKLPVVSIEPDQAEAHFGWLARFAGHDMPASSALTRQKLNWKPTGPGLTADLDAMDHELNRFAVFGAKRLGIHWRRAAGARQPSNWRLRLFP